MNFRVLPSVLMSSLLLSGCGFFKTQKPVAEGERETVMLTDQLPEMTMDSTSQDVTVPPCVHNADWAQAGGCPSHDMPPAAVGDKLQVAWEQSIGGSSSGDHRLLSEPVVYHGVVSVLNTNGEVRSYEVSSGKPLWSTSIEPESGATNYIGGGLAVDHDHVYVTSPSAEVLALDHQSGHILWRTSTDSPIRAAPTVFDGRVYVVDINNVLSVFDADTGDKLWNHRGIVESTGILGSASPAVSGDSVVVPYSSGEVYALQTQTGSRLWADTLASLRRVDSLSTIPHIRARPVISGTQVFLVSQSGSMSAIDLRTGRKMWNRTIGGIQSPAVAGKYVFVISSNNSLICLNRHTGRAAWIQQLPQFESPEDQKGPLVWSGPLIAGNHLYLVGNNRKMSVHNISNGEQYADIALPGSSSIPPIAASGTIFILTDGGDLVAMR
ncbi:MAG: PQQ-binding-like beta-propeller repeat protein [Alphaproteobacteria bacterium]